MPNFDMRFEDGIKTYDGALDEAENAVLDMGLPLSTRPSDGDRFTEFPEIPPDLSKSTFPELQKLIGQFTAWYAYAIGQQKLSEGQRNAAEKKRAYAWSRIRKSKTGTVADKDDDTRVDRRYIDVDSHYEHCDAKYRILLGIVDGLKRDIETISRTASVLEARQGAEGRGVAVGRKGRDGSSGRGRSNDVLTQFRKGRRR